MNERHVLKGTWIPQVVIIALLLIAFNPGNPYGYYIGLRWACFGCFSFLAYRAYQRKMVGWLWTFVFVAVAYNPFFKVHFGREFGREIWSAVNVISIGIAIASIFALRPSKEDGERR